MNKLVSFIKINFGIISKIILTIYLIYGSIALLNINVTSLTHPLEFFIIISVQISYNASIAIYLYFLWIGKSNDNLNRNILIYSTIFVTLSFPATYGILSLGRQLSNIDGVKIGTADGWLSFIGSLLGGIITMTALIFTIKHEKNIRIEESQELKNQFAYQTIPIVIVQIPEIAKKSNIKHSDIETNIKKSKSQESNEKLGVGEHLIEEDNELLNNFPVFFEILNTSEHHAKNISFSKFEVYKYWQHYFGFNKPSQVLIHDYLENITLQDINCKILPGRYNSEFYLDINYKFFEKNVLKFLIDIEYYDIQELKQHKTTSEIIVKFKYEKIISINSDYYDLEVCIESIKNSAKFIY